MGTTTDPTPLEWATSTVIDPVSGQTNKIEPNASKKSIGWYFLEKPPFQWFNYWMNGVHVFLQGLYDNVLIGDYTFSGNKTFSGETHMTGDIYLTGGIKTKVDTNIGITEKYLTDSTTLNSANIKTDIMNIGTWVMNVFTGGSPAYTVKTITTTIPVLTLNRVIDVQVTIIKDDQSKCYPLGTSTVVGGAEYRGGFYSISQSGPTLTINLAAYAAGLFFTTDFDGTQNRGYITITYRN